MPTYIICGPTASGKSTLSLDLARHQDGHILNADSMQLYKELPILSAQPSLVDQTSIPHFLYSTLSIAEINSVGKWLHAVQTVLKKSSIKTPIFVGGTGLYLKALLEGLSPIPDIPPSVRQELESLLISTSKDYLFQLLKKEDPLTAEKIGPHNTQRILRALEVIRYTQKPLLEWHQIAKEKIVSLPLPIKIILIDPDRDALYAVINQRVELMLDSGAIEEVQTLKENHIIPSTTGQKMLGYEEICAYLGGHLSRKEMTEQIQQKTRHYAKRQMTWFRHQLSPDFIWPKVYAPSDWSGVLSKMKW
jgi:tRNA dimethylallyltransferase